MNLNAIFRKKEDVVTRSIAGETILIPIRDNLADMQGIYTLNPVAEYIWQQLDGKQNLENIASGVSASFEAAPPETGEDMVEFINQLLTREIIEEVR